MDGSHVSSWRVAPGDQPRLGERDTASTVHAPGDRVATEAAAAAQSERLADFQDRLWAEKARSLLVVLQGMDASGKDGTIKRVFSGVNPQGVKVASFKQPTPEELGHDFLWRVHKEAPGAGEIGIFNRSHYESVLVERVERLVPKSVWKDRYEDIVAFERTLHRSGTAILKLFLHISYEEQGERLRARIERPNKRWKLSRSDFVERAKWDAYAEAYEEALARTSSPHAPWYVIPADKKWYRDWVVGEILVHALQQMDPRFPEPPPLDGFGTPPVQGGAGRG